MPLKGWQVLLAGVIATASMDVLTAVSIRLRLIAPLSPNVVGRWFASVVRAHPFHEDIARAAPIRHELAIALPGHYAIGMFLFALFVVTAHRLGWPARNLSPALTFGVCTNVFPWLLMFPAMGYGFFGAHGPEGTRLFVSSLVSHAFFGFGIWMAIRVMSLA
jgi:Protein of unknown function (DUF2938)